jgi:hypothetical protein
MADLFQIRKGYRADWRDLAFFVESGDQEWTLRVHRSGEAKPLFTGERCGVTAARSAAVEFGVFQELGAGSPVIPAQLAKELNWQEYW